MASGYNLVGRPPVVAGTGGTARLLVRRESLADVRSRDVGLRGAAVQYQTNQALDGMSRTSS